MQNLVAKIVWNLIWIPGTLLFRFFLHFQAIHKGNGKKLKRPLIVVANHSSALDPFLIGAAFPWRSHIFPIQFAMWYKYFWFPLLTPFAWALGAYPIRKGIGLENALRSSIKILESRGVVGIFPEGKRRHLGRPRNPRVGAIYLALKTNTKILPVYIEGSLGMNLLKFFTRSKKVKVVVGEPFLLKRKAIKHPEDLKEISSIIEQKIEELKKTI